MGDSYPHQKIFSQQRKAGKEGLSVSLCSLFTVIKEK
jgi:hypothetical protein